MTGSAYQAMDVFVLCDSLYRVGVWGRDGTAVEPDPRLADCPKINKKPYVFIGFLGFLGGRKMIGFWIGFSVIFGSILERFLDRFWKGFWIDFGEVLG